MNSKEYLESIGIDIRKFIQIPTNDPSKGHAIMLYDLLDSFANQINNGGIDNIKVCPLCNGTGRRKFPNCNPPIDEECPACKDVITTTKL